jgi:hypothetical protein
VAKHRDKQKLLADCNVTGNATCNATVTECNATDKNRKEKNRKEKKKADDIIIGFGD